VSKGYAVKDQSTRARIVRAADELFYCRGFENTSFADVASAVQISRGNFYHHFKSKDEILGAVISARLSNTRGMLERWESADEEPTQRIRSFVDILIANRALIRRFGCPVGTLCSELAKLEHSALPEANMLFSLFRTWLRRQFELVGRGTDADALALHVLARSQGIAMLANAFADESFIRREVKEMHAWLDAAVTNCSPRELARS